MGDVALEVPLAALALGRRRQRGDAGDARVEVLRHALDRAPLAGGIAPLEDHDQPCALGPHPLLDLDQLAPGAGTAPARTASSADDRWTPCSRRDAWPWARAYGRDRSAGPASPSSGRVRSRRVSTRRRVDVGRCPGEFIGPRQDPPSSWPRRSSTLRCPAPGSWRGLSWSTGCSAASAPPVVAVVAPPGYGKTTLLAQWAQHRRPRVAWVSADERDNDPAVLLTYLAVVLDRIEPIDPAVWRALTMSGADIAVPPRLVAAIGAMDQPVTLVVDHFEVITNRECLDVDRRARLALARTVTAGDRLARHLPRPSRDSRPRGGSPRSAPMTSRSPSRTCPRCSQGQGSSSPMWTCMSSSARPRAGRSGCTSRRLPCGPVARPTQRG